MSPTDEGRLELDDDGRVVDATGGVAGTVDLADPDATVVIPPTRAHHVLATSVSPWLRRHPRPVAAAAVATLAVALTTAWFTHRPPYVAPVVPIAIEDAVLDGRDLGGPSIRDDGLLSIAYSVRSTDPSTRFDVLGVTGPGLAPVGPAQGHPPTSSTATPAASTAAIRVQTQSVIQCANPVVDGATRSSYALEVRRIDATGAEAMLSVPFGADVNDLSIAVHDYCLSHYAVPALSIIDSAIRFSAGTSVASLELIVRNTSNVAVTVATIRGPDGDVEVDLSPTVTIAPQRSAVVSSRLLVRDCSSRPRPAALVDLPNPVIGAGYGDPGAMPGLTLHVSSAGRSTLASYALGRSLADVGALLTHAACAAAPTFRTVLTDVSGTLGLDGSWTVSGTYLVRTSGVGVSVGSEHFDGPPWGAGSVLASGDQAGTPWALVPSSLDGGDGHLPLRFSGPSCADALAEAPGTIAVRITAADREVYPFEVAVDRAVLGKALAAACPTP